MIITIDTEELSKLNISILEFVFLYYLFEKIDPIDQFVHTTINIPKLIEEKFILPHKNIYILTAKARNLFKITKDKPVQENSQNKYINSLEQLSIQYRELFPKGVKSGGRPVRVNPKDLEKRFKKFFNKYSYTPSQVINATKLYLEEKERDGFKFLTCSDYFILKEDNQGEKSLLANFIDHLGEKEEQYEEQKSFERRL